MNFVNSFIPLRVKNIEPFRLQEFRILNNETPVFRTLQERENYHPYYEMTIQKTSDSGVLYGTFSWSKAHPLKPPFVSPYDVPVLQAGDTLFLFSSTFYHVRLLQHLLCEMQGKTVQLEILQIPMYAKKEDLPNLSDFQGVNVREWGDVEGTLRYKEGETVYYQISPSGLVKFSMTTDECMVERVIECTQKFFPGASEEKDAHEVLIEIRGSYTIDAEHDDQAREGILESLSEMCEELRGTTSMTLTPEITTLCESADNRPVLMGSHRLKVYDSTFALKGTMQSNAASQEESIHSVIAGIQAQRQQIEFAVSVEFEVFVQGTKVL